VLIAVGAGLIATHYIGALLGWPIWLFDWLTDASDGTGSAWLNVTVRVCGQTHDALWSAWTAEFGGPPDNPEMDGGGGPGPQWLVDGVYYEHQRMSMWIEMQISYRNVENITIVNATIWTVAWADINGWRTPVGVADYIFAEDVELDAGGSEGSVSWTSDVIERSFNEHIYSDMNVPDEIDEFDDYFHVHVIVIAYEIGTGEQLTAEAGPNTPFSIHHFQKVTGDISAAVTGNVVFSSWMPVAGVTFLLTGVGIAAIALSTVLTRSRRSRRWRRRGRKR